MSIVEDVIDLCDIDAGVARQALGQALERSGFVGPEPTAQDIRRALPELRRALEQVTSTARAYEASERVDLLLAEDAAPTAQSSPPVAPASLAEVTRRLRESNRAMSSRDYEGEVADMEAAMIVRRQRRSLIPPAK